ncbi:hypothetical protein DBY63_012395 [Pseudomonas sp. RIT411]|nr:hypothetical protein DBY63_012395 [Pseudomonas sp. RIT 411]
MDSFLPVPDSPSRQYLLRLHRHFNARLDELHRLSMDDPKLEEVLRDFEGLTQRTKELVEEVAVRLALEASRPSS